MSLVKIRRYCTFGILWTFLSLVDQNAAALELDANEIRGKKTKKPVKILQNRFFKKAFRPEVGLITGRFVNEAYTSTIFAGGRLTFFYDEWLGLEFQKIWTSVEESADRKSLNELKYRRLETDEVVSPDPDTNAIAGSTDLSVVYAPFYGKLNFADKVIIYADLYASLGLSKVDTDQGSLNSISWAFGQRLYWKKSISFRFEIKDRIYIEDRNGSDHTKPSYSADIGVSYYLF